MERLEVDHNITLRPTQTYQGFNICPGNPLPFGASLVPGGINFSIYSYHATSCTLVLFEKGSVKPLVEIPIPEKFRIGSVYPIIVLGIDPDEIEYGYRMDGPQEPKKGHYFNPDALLLDPYARAVGGREIWGTKPDYDNQYQHRARIVRSDTFDWGMDRPLETPIE